MMLLRKRAQMV